MSKSKRRRRSKQRKKAKLRKQLRKIQRRRNRELQHSEYLSIYRETYIDEAYRRGEITLYRWTHYPIIEDDFRPQIFQSTSDRDISEVDAPSPNGNIKRIAKYVERFTLSHFLTEEQAIESYNVQLSNLRNSDHPERADGFIANKGSYVTKCNYTEDDILFGTADEYGHINALPCNGFDPNKVIDTTYTPVNIV